MESTDYVLAKEALCFKDPARYRRVFALSAGTVFNPVCDRSRVQRPFLHVRRAVRYVQELGPIGIAQFQRVQLSISVYLEGGLKIPLLDQE